MLLASLFLALSQAQVAAQCPPAGKGVHVVQKGETLYSISKKYGLKVEELTSMNGISASQPLLLCQQLKVNKSATTTTTTKPQPKPEPTSPTYQGGSQLGGHHVVKPGETVGSIARMYGYTEERFRSINGFGPRDVVRPDMVLSTSHCVCPDPTSPQPKPAEADTPSKPTGQPSNQPWVSTPLTSDEPSSVPTPKPSGSNYAFNEDPFGETTAPASYNNEPANTANLGDSGSYMSSEEMEMVREINLIRSNPAGYVRYVQAYRDRIAAGDGFGSVATCDELIAELKKTQPLAILQPAQCIYNAAKRHGLDQLQIGSTNHVGSDGSYPWNRVRRECPGMSDGNENLVGGPSNVREAVMMLLVDDGISTRGHRRNLLDPSWRYVACYKIGQVGDMPNSWVQNFGK